MKKAVADLEERDRTHDARWAVVIFLILAVGIGASGFWYYGAQKKNRLAETERQISAIADLKIHEIESWRKERTGDAAVVVSNPFFASDIRSILEGAAPPKSKDGVVIWMESIRNAYGYSKILLLDARTRPILQTEDPADTDLDETTRRAAETALRESRPAVTDLHVIDEKGTVRMDVLAPVSGTVGAAAAPGIFVFRIDPYQYLYPLIQSWPISSATAETLLVRREGTDVLYLNELRHQKGTALKMRFPISRERLPAAKAVGGYQGIVRGSDYRDIQVLSAVRAIPDSPWFLVAKVDLEEIMSPIRREGRLLAILGLVLIAAAGAGIAYLIRSEQVRHLRKERAERQERRALIQHFEYLTKFANDAIFLMDLEGWFTEVNEQACKAYGYSREELLRRNLRDIRSRDIPDNVEANLAAIREEGGRIFESVHVRKDGTSFPVEISAHRLPAGGRAFFQYIVRNIEERKKAENEIRRLNADLEERVRLRTAELEAALKELEAFSYSVSHDLRAPLRVIDGYSLALFEEYEPRLDKEALFYLSRIRSNTQDMGRIIDDMLTLARTSQSEIRLEDVDLSAMARKSAEDIARGWPGRDVAVTIADGLTVRTDPRLLRTVLDNLFDNAWKFTAKTPGARVEFGAVPGSEVIPTYFIRDNGAGFDMAYAGKLFGIFQRLHPRDEFPGTGIGLATVQRIVCRLGGRVWAEGETGRGAAFYFILGSEKGGSS